MRSILSVAVRIAVLIVSLSPNTLAQTTTRDAPDSTPPSRVRLPRPVEVPLVASGLAGVALPVVEITIDGRGPFRFGIETGAGFVGMRRALADSLGLRRTGGPDDYPEFAVDSVNLGASSFQDLRVVGMPRAAAGVDGVLGLPFFHDVLLTLDYPRHLARLERDSLPAPNGRDVLALSRVGPFWAMPLSIGGTTFRAVIDTRSTGTFSMTPAGASALSFDGELATVGRARGVAIPETEVKAGRLATDARLGRFTFPHPFVAVRPLPPGFPEGPLVGAAVLQHFAISLDQRRSRLRLAHTGSDTIPLPEPRRPSTPGGPNDTASSGLAAYVGHYGERSVTLESNTLHLQRAGGPLLELVATGADRFDIRGIPEAKVEFERDAAGHVAAIRVLARGGVWERATRDGGMP